MKHADMERVVRLTAKSGKPRAGNREGARSTANQAENRRSLRDRRSKNLIRGIREIYGQNSDPVQPRAWIGTVLSDAELNPAAA